MKQAISAIAHFLVRERTMPAPVANNAAIALKFASYRFWRRFKRQWKNNPLNTSEPSTVLVSGTHSVGFHSIAVSSKWGLAS